MPACAGMTPWRGCVSFAHNLSDPVSLRVSGTAAALPARNAVVSGVTGVDPPAAVIPVQAGTQSVPVGVG